MPRTCQPCITILALALILFSCSSENGESDGQTTGQEITSGSLTEDATDTATPRSEPLESVVKSLADTEEPLADNNESSALDSTPLQARDLLPSESSRADDSTEKNTLATVDSLDPAKPYCLGLGQENAKIIESACLNISNRLASVTNEGCLAAKLMLSRCKSVQQFPILYSEFPPLGGNPAKGKILVVGGIHGDELTSVSMVFRWIEKLNQYHTGLFHWHMVPMMNPDGVLNPAATRTNANGVDLNRNLPSDDWTENALFYWQQKTDNSARRYPGEHAASEPETQWLIDEINSFEPDAIIAVHAPYGLVDFDAPVLTTAPKSLGRLMLNILGTYPGSLGNYAGINRNIPVITLELPHAWVMPSDSETAKLWEDIVRWLRTHVDNPTPAES